MFRSGHEGKMSWLQKRNWICRQTHPLQLQEEQKVQEKWCVEVPHECEMFEQDAQRSHDGVHAKKMARQRCEWVEATDEEKIDGGAEKT